jgi:uncharacterized membrane protein HdeD (DUF308 family)
MTDPADTIKKSGTSMSIFGAIAILLGILAMLAPGLTGLSVAVFLGFVVLAAGFVRILWAFSAGSLGKGILSFVIGALTVICGLMLVTDPLLATGFLTIILAVYFIVDGIAEIAAGTQRRPKPGSGWLIFGGIVSLVLGIMIWSQFPLSGAWAMGILLGIKLFTIGLIMITGGSVIRKVT